MVGRTCCTGFQENVFWELLDGRTHAAYSERSPLQLAEKGRDVTGGPFLTSELVPSPFIWGTSDDAARSLPRGLSRDDGLRPEPKPSRHLTGNSARAPVPLREITL